MSKTTTNYGLTKPELTDAADITAMNQNWDKIDEVLDDKIGTMGGTMVGNLIIRKPSGAFAITDTDINSEAIYQHYNHALSMRVNNVAANTSTYRGLLLQDSSVVSNINTSLSFVDKKPDKTSADYYPIIHTGNKSLIKPEDIGAMPIAVAAATVG